MIIGERQVERFGDRVAVVCDGSLSYRELHALVNRCGNVLRDAGLGPRQRVVMCLRDTPLLLAAYLGAMKIGAVPIAVSTRLGAEDIGAALAEAGAPLLVGDAELPEWAVSASRRVTRVRADELARRVRSAPVRLETHAVSADDEAFWVYSSGSTGRSKGVIHRHGELHAVTSYHRDELGVAAGDMIFCTSRLSFAYTLGNGLFAPLYLGAATLLHADWPSPASSLQLVRSARPTHVFSVPSLYRAWLALPPEQTQPLAEVRHFVSAGEALPRALNERWRDRFGRSIQNCYGCSETVFFVFATPTSASNIDATGRLVPGASAQLQPRNGAGAGERAPGRLFIKHPFLALGYSDGARAQQGRFSAGWFETGDLFRRDADGYWTFCGRDDDLCKVAGQWVNLRDIEEAAQSCPGVAAAAAVTVPDRDGLQRIALFVTPSAAAPALVESVTAGLEERLVPHKRPKWIRVIDEFPRTVTGKIRKADLKELVRGDVV